MRRSLETNATPSASPVDDPATASDESGSTGVWPTFLPATYMEEPRLRIQAYRTTGRCDAARRGGKTCRLPGATGLADCRKPRKNLLRYTRFKLLAASRKLQQVEVRGSKLMLTRGADFVLCRRQIPPLDFLRASL